MAYHYKVVAFDFDGTLLLGNSLAKNEKFNYSWKELWLSLGLPYQQHRRLHQEFNRSAKQAEDYERWCQQVVKEFRDAELTKSKILECIREPRPTNNDEEYGLYITPGTFNTLKFLRNKKIRMCVISGGIVQFIEGAMEVHKERTDEDLRPFFDEIYANRFEFAGDKVTDVIPSKYDFEGKIKAIDEMCRLVGCSRNECIFIGDQVNDIPVFKEVGLSIAFTADETGAVMEADHRITSGNLWDLIKQGYLALPPKPPVTQHSVASPPAASPSAEPVTTTEQPPAAEPAEKPAETKSERHDRRMSQFRGALAESFDRTSLQEMLNDQFGKWVVKRLSWEENLAPTVQQLVDLAVQGGWHVDLLQAAMEFRSESGALHALGNEFGLSPSISFDLGDDTQEAGLGSPGFESIVNKLDGFFNVVPFAKGFLAAQASVCRILIESEFAGTGFLIGPDLVLTSYHGVSSAIDGTVSPENIICEFDYKLIDDQTAPFGHSVFLADDNWLVDWSPYSNKEQTGTSTIEELDYAVLRLAESIGNQPTRDRGEVRGWINLPTALPSLSSAPGMVIAQHPLGQPMKFTARQDSFVSMNETRIRYRNNTQPGSSGAPCFTFDWDLVALHHYGDTSQQASWNQGVRADVIGKRLRNKNVALEVFEKRTRRRPKPVVDETESESAIDIWVEKLEYYEREFAIVSDVQRKFELKYRIKEAKQKIFELGGPEVIPKTSSAQLVQVFKTEFGDFELVDIVCECLAGLDQLPQHLNRRGYEKFALALPIAQSKFDDACYYRANGHDAEAEIVTCVTLVVTALAQVFDECPHLRRLMKGVCDAAVLHDDICGQTDWQKDRLLSDLYRVVRNSKGAQDKEVFDVLLKVIEL